MASARPAAGTRVTAFTARATLASESQGFSRSRADGEASGEDGLLGARAFAFEVFRRDEGVAEGLQQLDRGGLREVLFVPPGGVGGHGVPVRYRDPSIGSISTSPSATAARASAVSSVASATSHLRANSRYKAS